MPRWTGVRFDFPDYFKRPHNLSQAVIDLVANQRFASKFLVATQLHSLLVSRQLFGYSQSDTAGEEFSAGNDHNVFSIAAKTRVGDAAGG